MTTTIARRIADELAVAEHQIKAAITLLDDGATVPFISRYRKEVTGGLDDTQMRHLDERLRYLRELEDRRAVILKSIDEQGKLTPQLEQALQEADTKNRLEDLYLPYKPRRRTKAQIAREAGLEPLAEALLGNPELEPEREAAAYLNSEAGIGDTRAALDGARQILMERFAEDADLLARLREFLHSHALLASRLVPGKEQEGAKFRDYFEHTEPLAGVPSHRALAMFRGRNEGFLQLNLLMDAEEKPTDSHPCEAMIAGYWQLRDQGRAGDKWLADTVRWTWRVKLLTHLQTDLLGQLREQAEQEAIQVFANNLKDLLLAAPAGARATIGMDPGLRTGVKVAVVDANGKLLDHTALFPNQPQNRTREAAAELLQLIRKHRVELIAIGNGTASRETGKFVGELLAQHPDLGCRKVMVNEAGASIYSASEFAAREFPDLDVTIRGAVSIARRLQDPLAELVKIEPKSIGVGQYQHDVSQVQLARQLDAVVEDCVNAVGVDVNTASAPLLARVSGLNQTLAANIVARRDEAGSFPDRKSLLKVARFGDKTFEQAAGFLRVNGGSNPLDASAVHPESYPVVTSIASRQQRDIASLIGDSSFLRSLRPEEYTSDSVGLPTVKDIIAELDKPGRDPRPEFRMATFQEGVEKLSDLKPDMVLEGTVTNVTNFGAFVDIGVHQDGLVHISALAERFVKDPRDVVKAGDVVRVKVMEVDQPRKRIALSMRLHDKAEARTAETAGGRPPRGSQRPRTHSKAKQDGDRQGGGSTAPTALAAAFASARKDRS
ncbi:Tex family protein [Kineobactrum salinum]|uniref:RNA-binding transcriptional accessory protein n=1 Tax=Kineobactrum salinum TaxID=2708301 RepID=A0A6C0U1L8_9GAMM|nr:Tex family protein [Kineobactrum salinum]QIB66022.1 RNA-binding transcriptional accessory protein [Kineobactrum salinum]